jgi:SAM-dependent methyltransferase
MREVNLLDSYPRAKRPIAANRAADEAQRAIARQFGREYFDGDRTQGYGGYRYDGRWVAVAKRMRDFYGLTPGMRVLDVGCAKGFLLHDLKQVVPGLEVAGVDVSEYALQHAMDDVRPFLVRGTAQHLPFADGAFDLVISINTVHNLERPRCLAAVRELERVSRRFKYLQIDSWLQQEHYDNLMKWVLTAVTFYDPDGWRELFREAGYTGDYYWTLAE